MALVKVLRHGQVTLPKEFREILGINEGDLMEAELDGSRILFKPKAVVDKEASLLNGARPAEDSAWAGLSGQQLSRAYGDQEPDYPVNSLKEPNPDFQP
jgi:AbrB family looped-hinge helix DNA binding protein